MEDNINLCNKRRLITRKVNRILLCFFEDITAIVVAKLVRVNRKTANNYYNAIHEKILNGEFKADKSCFGARRVRSRRGREAAGKTPVFGLLKRGRNVLVKAVEKCSKKEEPMPVIQGKVLEGSVIHTDGWKTYDGLIKMVVQAS